MNIFNKAALEGMKKSRTRTIVTIIGVILSATMITAVSTFAVSLQSYMVNCAVQKYGNWHTAFLDVDSSFVKERAQDKKVTNTISFENIGYAELNGGKNPNKPYVFIAGYQDKTFDALPVNLISGRLPRNSGEILVPAHLTQKGGIKLSVGDKLTLSIGERMDGNKNLSQHDPYISGNESGEGRETFTAEGSKTYTVVGICQRASFEEFSAPGYTLITKADAGDKADRFTTFVAIKSPRQIRAYARKMDGTGNYIFNDDVLRFLGLSDDKLFNTFLYSIGGILVALIMIGSIFLIYNSFNISLNERTQQFGILSSVGATPKQLRNSVLFEGLCIGAIGIPIGILTGIISIRIVISIVGENFGNILNTNVPVTLTVSVPAILISVIVSMATILISAYIPARKAANTPVMECIRQTNDVRIQSKDVKTSKSAERIYGLEGILALKSFKRNKRRYRSIVLSLTLSVVLFVSASAFEMDMKAFAKQFVEVGGFDICFTSSDMKESEMFQLYDKLKNVDGVCESSYQANGMYFCNVQTSDFSDSYRKYKGYKQEAQTVELPMKIQFVEDSVYLKFLKDIGLNKKDYTGENAKMIAVAKAEVVDNEKNKDIHYIDIFAGRSMDFTIAPKSNGAKAAKENVNITFIDKPLIDTLPTTFTQANQNFFLMIAPYEQKKNFETTDMGLTFDSKNPSLSENKMRAIIQDAEVTSDYTLYNFREMIEQNSNIIFVVDVFTYVFVVMISLIAIANVFNTISTNIKLRRRELSMLRSVGMSDRSFQKMMNFECVFYGMRTLLFGIPIAGSLSFLIYKGIVSGGADISFYFPWVSMGISVLGVFFVVFITMLYSTSKIKKENIIDALRDDMT